MPIVNIGKNLYISDKMNVLLEAGNNYADYLWSNGSKEDTLRIYGKDLGIGTHTVWIRVKNQYQCMTYDTASIYVTKASEIEENSPIKHLDIYPNPNNGIFYVEIASKERISNISVFDLEGSMIYTKNFYEDEDRIMHRIELSDCSKGIYLLRIQVGSLIFNQKIFINP